MPTLIQFRLCPMSRSIRLALGELDMPVQLTEEQPWAWRTELLSLNPSGDLPVLQLDDGIVIAGAYAISEYLGEMVRHASVEERIRDLFPGNDEDRAEVRRLVDWFHLKLDREVSRELLRARVHVRLGADGGDMPPDAEVMRVLRANLRYHLSYVAYLADSRRWLAGDELSFADFAAAGHLSCLDYLGEIAWDEQPAAREWYMRVKSRPCFRSLLADRVGGVPPSPHYANLDF